MEKEFIPYEEALELKELGFNEPCFGKYLSSAQSNWKVYELILEMGMNEEFEDNRNVYFLDGACSAPTFSQAFKWFREKHNHNSFIYHHKTVNNLVYFAYILDNDLFETNFKIYEEAQLACLRKLIEIIKSKQHE